MLPISRCFNSHVLNLCQQAMYLEKLTAIVKQYLPESLAAAVSVGNFERGCLTLVITDPIWATELRFCLASLRDQLRTKEKLYQLTSIKIIGDGFSRR